MSVFHGCREVENGQQNKNQRLDDGNEYAETENWQRSKVSAGQHEKNAQQSLFRHDITEKTNGERKNTGQMTDNLDGEHQGNKPGNGAEEMFDVSGAVKFETENMSCNKDDQGTAQSNVDA